MRHAIAVLILVLVGVGRSAAAPYNIPVQPEMAPMRGEPQAAPKVPSQAPSQAQSQKPAQQHSQTQGQRQSEPPGGTAKEPPAAVQGPPAMKPSGPAQGNAVAGDRQPAAERRRYTFHRIKDDFLRLDSRTGEVTQCGWQATGWSCKAVPDERAALDSEIARLQRENAALKSSLLSHGIALPGAKPDVPAAKDGAPAAKTPEAAPTLKLPNATDIDRAVAFAKDVWRRLLEMMVELQRDIQHKS